MTAMGPMDGAAPSMDRPGLAEESTWDSNFEAGQGDKHAQLENQRWRELFPLPTSTAPSASPGSSVSQRRRRAKVRERVGMVNDIVGCLNEMYNAPSSSSSSSNPSLAQQQSQHVLFKQLERVQLPSSGFCSEREAAQELLHTQAVYDGTSTSSTVRPYERDLVSLPEVGSSLVPLSQVLDDTGREVVENPSERMLVDEESWGYICEKNAGFRPYMDTILKEDTNKYNQFICDLMSKNMVDFTSSPKDLIAPFFCGQKVGQAANGAGLPRSQQALFAAAPFGPFGRHNVESDKRWER